MGSASRQANLLGLQKKQLANLVSKKALADCIDNVTQVTHGISTRTYAAT
jgi:hypothetical protein